MKDMKRKKVIQAKLRTSESRVIKVTLTFIPSGTVIKIRVFKLYNWVEITNYV